jgi:hypothetical protein
LDKILLAHCLLRPDPERLRGTGFAGAGELVVNKLGEDTVSVRAKGRHKEMMEHELL